MAPNPLSAASVIEQMAEALPTHEKDDTTSDLSSSLDAVALFVHACMASLEFKLLGFSEDQNMATECAKIAPRLPAQWNKSLSSHSFVYSHDQSSMQFLIRIDRIGSKIDIRGLGVGDERIAKFDITARDYIASAALPVRIAMSGDDGVEDRGDDLKQKLKRLFTSEQRQEELTTLLKTKIIQPILPNLYKKGYEETPDDRAARQDADAIGRSGARPPPQIPNPLPEPANPYPMPHDPLAMPPRRPVPAGDFPPPGFEDEYEVLRPPRRGVGSFAPGGGQSPFGIGDRDLYPQGLGPHDPLRGSFVPSPFGGGLRQPGRGGGGGMHPTFDDPLFRGPRGDEDPAFDSQVPPGARWDPLGPGGAPRFGGGRPGAGGGGFGGFGGGDII